MDTDYRDSPLSRVRDQVDLYVRTQGREGRLQPDTGLPIALFSIKGRKTGLLRRVPLMRIERGGAYLMVASNGGSPRNPAWYHSVLQNPDVEVQDGPRVFTAGASLLAGSDREEWWAFAVDCFPYYANHQRRTRRIIPLFLARPR